MCIGAHSLLHVTISVFTILMKFNILFQFEHEICYKFAIFHVLNSYIIAVNED